MLIYHVGNDWNYYKHIEQAKEGDEFGLGSPHTILDACPTWGCAMPTYSHLLEVVKWLKPSHTIVMHTIGNLRSVEELAQYTKVIIQGWVSDWDLIIDTFPSLYGVIVVSATRRVAEIISYVSNKIVSVPIWLRDISEHSLPETLFHISRSLEPFIEGILTSEAINAASMGIVFDNFAGNRITIPGYNLHRSGLSTPKIIFAYNQLCITAWSQGVHPVSFDNFLKGEF